MVLSFLAKDVAIMPLVFIDTKYDISSILYDLGVFNTPGMQSLMQQMAQNPQLMQNMTQAPYIQSMMQTMAANPELAQQVYKF